ncbi:MAG: tRNA lysidine(34) synthetase TilS, partial [Candidatus Marinimicrobia bacterium]|nr:tRNA lysidine(34) synthetase TilS [Candidatus Neomarinimicrobiota bacterium]
MTTSFSLHELEKYFDNLDVPLQETHCLVAFSGGLDSTVLARAMMELARLRGGKITLAHVNHRLRQSAADDETFCRSFATDFNVPLVVCQLDSSGRGSESVEAWARRERYAALENIAHNVGAQWILTGHHADDQAETVLMRLRQQAPFITMAGIRPRRGRILRPLLEFTRAALHTWAQGHDLVWIEDPSNEDRAYLRNRLRLDDLTALRRQNPGAVDALTGLAGLAQQYEHSCAREAEELLRQSTADPVAGILSFPLKAVRSQADDVLRLAIYSTLEQYFAATDRLSGAHWHSLRQFVRFAETGKVFDITKNVKMLKDREALLLFDPLANVSPEPRRLRPGKTTWGGHLLEVAGHDGKVDDLSLSLRSWHSGDRLANGRHGKGKLVSDIFINGRVNRLDKQQWPMVTDEHDRVIWVPGLMDPRKQLEYS